MLILYAHEFAEDVAAGEESGLLLMPYPYRARPTVRLHGFAITGLRLSGGGAGTWEVVG